MRVFKELGGWLHIRDDEVAALAGIARTTARSWLREGREPRPSTARRLYQLHALAAAVAGRLGDEGARLWFAAGDPAPRDLLLEGDLEPVERRVQGLLFQRPPDRRVQPRAWLDEERPPLAVAPRAKPPRPRRRRPLRGRPTRDR